MRVTPLICWSCNNWFLPKTKRKTKFCCNACRQANYVNKKTDSLVQLYWNNEDERDELSECLSSHCKDGQENCVQCLFENNYDLYCDMVYQKGRDKYNQSVKRFLMKLDLL
jgi:hypothetical protein